MATITGDLRGDLANSLPPYKDHYTSYQASPFLEATATCPPMSSTPNRVRIHTQSWRHDIPAYCDAYPHIASTPRSFVTPQTSSLSMKSVQTVFSPSPLPLSQVPSLMFPGISPPSQGSGNTPFERQFIGGFYRLGEWNNPNTQISPVARSSIHSLFSLSPACTNVTGTPSRTPHGPTFQDSQDVLERVSLIDRFISAAENEPSTTERTMPFSTLSSQDCSSPLSDLSDLTPLSSPESSDHIGRELDLRSSSPPPSPTVERLGSQRWPNNDQHPNLGPGPPLTQSARNPSPSRDSNYQPAKGAPGCKRKRTSRSRDGNAIQTKRRKTRSANAPETASTDTNSSLVALNRRRLPTNIPYHPEFSLFYLRFPVSPYLRLADGKFPLLSAESMRIAGTYNEPRETLDLYTPRFVKGCGATKLGVCPICIESPSRGGKGEVVWLSMKFSAYKCYHLQYAHGISSVSARPFSPPVAFRTIDRQNPAKNERTSIQEGKCHRCKKWILVESIKNIDIKVKELYWWKHAAACHQGTRIEGDDDFFLDDEIYRRVQQMF